MRQPRRVKEGRKSRIGRSAGEGRRTSAADAALVIAGSENAASDSAVSVQADSVDPTGQGGRSGEWVQRYRVNCDRLATAFQVCGIVCSDSGAQRAP